MHKHDCRHCGRDFVCDEALECFAEASTCRECFWRHELPHFLLFLFFGTVAIVLIVAASHFCGGRP